MIIILYLKDCKRKVWCHVTELRVSKHSWRFVCAVTEMKY